MLTLTLALSCSAAYPAPPKAPPAPPPPAVDDDFLEFLGSVDAEPIRPEDLWLVDYWARPPAKAPPPAAKPAPTAPKPSPPPAGTQNNG